jgi:hypothetical protein
VSAQQGKSRETAADPQANAAPAPAPAQTPATPQTREMNSGRVAFDARGNAVWEWRTGDGEFKRDASTTIVRKLEPTGLAIEATGIVRKPRLNSAAPKVAEPTTGAIAESAPPPIAFKEPSGCDPYDSSRNASHVRQAARRPAPKPAGKIVVAPERKGIIGRLLGRR